MPTEVFGDVSGNKEHFYTLLTMLHLINYVKIHQFLR